MEQQFAPKVTEYPLENVRRNVLQVPYKVSQEHAYLFQDVKGCQTEKVGLEQVKLLGTQEVLDHLEDAVKRRNTVLEKRVYVDR